MSRLIRTVKSGELLRVYKTLGAIQGRQGSHWYPDYKPGPLPKTEEERIAAAKKYNLLPEEYETYPEGSGHGDYPKLEFESVDSRDPWYPWDNPELRKNFNEPVHVRIVNALPEQTSTGRLRVPHWLGFVYYLLLLSGSGLFVYLLNKIELIHPVTEKQYVTAGVTHYTFEPDYDEWRRRQARKGLACFKDGKEIPIDDVKSL